MKILSIDQSYTCSGIVVLDDKNILYADVFQTNPQLSIYERALSLAIHIQTLSDEHKPDVISLEGLSFGSFGNAVRDLSGLLFTVITKLLDNDFLMTNIMLISPKVVKKTATGLGTAKKTDIYKATDQTIIDQLSASGVKKSKGLYDILDAYWIGISTYNSFNKN